METDLPIYGLACPSTNDQEEFDTALSPSEKKCGCTMKTTLQLVSGTVRNGETKRPFEAGLVNVYNVTRGNGTTADTSGVFHIKAAPSDTISISFVGFKTMQIKAVQLPALIQLGERKEVLNEVVITGNKKKPKKNYLLTGLGLTALLFVYAIAKDEKKKPKKTYV